MRAVIVAVVLGLSAVSAVPTRQQKIVGGALTSISQYPTIAALLYSWSGSNFQQSCGGTILTTRTILTAAHCPYGDAVSRWRVRVGSTYANSGGSVHALNSIRIHPSYNPRVLDNDVSLLYTSTPITYSNVAQAASIAGRNYYLGDNQAVWAAGWGTTWSGGPTSDQLRHVQIWTINQVTCKNRFAANGATITDNMLCSGWLDVGGRDQCQGDSGGPLYHNGVVVGVCSWGNGCALAQFPGVNTRVSRFATWIQSNA